MRYKEKGHVHRDFYRTLNATISYITERYGEDFLKKTFRMMARDVYRSIREDLRNGDPTQLVEHWTYYFDRENGEYEIERQGDAITFKVNKCPAIRYLQEQNISISSHFCSQTVEVNKALAEDTPFEIITKITDRGACRQLIRRRP